VEFVYEHFEHTEFVIHMSLLAAYLIFCVKVGEQNRKAPYSYSTITRVSHTINTDKSSK
jgi:hypothetical protein